MPGYPEHPAEIVARWIEELRAGGKTIDDWEKACDELKRLGFHVVPYLINALAHQDGGVRLGVKRALAGMGQIALPDLIAALKHSDARIRENVALLLYGKTQHPDSLIADLIPVLIEAMHDPVEEVRTWAIRALSNYHSHAEAIVPVCIEALKDPCFFVREWAASTLGAYGSAAEEAIPALTEALVDDDPEVRREASNAIDKIQGPACPDEGDEWKLK